jgi:hypothetical protein
MTFPLPTYMARAERNLGSLDLGKVVVDEDLPMRAPSAVSWDHLEVVYEFDVSMGNRQRNRSITCPNGEIYDPQAVHNEN